MSFLHPILLGLGAACVAIPVVIHLLMRRRRKPVRWAAMRFLLEAQRQRHRRVRLEQLLLLLTRCLLVALVALAVARPILGPDDGDRAGPREVYLLVDNSLTSAAIGEGDQHAESDLQRSLARARELLGTLDPARGDRAALITLAAPAQAVVSPPTSDLGVIERRLAELRPADSRLDLAGAVGLLPPMPSGDGAPGVTVAVYSAFREGSLGHGTPHGPLPAGATLTATPPAETTLGNTAIASFELLRPVVIASPDDAVTGLSQARATLRRWGAGLDQAALTTLRVVTDRSGASRELGAAVVRWSPGQREAQTTIDLDLAGLGRVGRGVLRAEIDRDANDRDNTALALLEVRERFRVALVGARRFGARPRLDDFGPSDWLRLALEPTDARADQIEVETLDAARLDAGALAGFDAAVVAEPARVRAEGWGSLGEFRARGGAVLLTVAPSLGAQLWPEQARAALDLPWEFDRDPAEIPEGARTLTAPHPDTPTPGAADPLWFIRAELTALAETVSVQRVLGVPHAGDALVLLETADARPVLLVTPPGASRAGPVALLATAVDLDWTDLPARPLMVPLMQELVRGGIGAGRSTPTMTAGSRLTAPAGAVEVVDREGADPRALPVDPSTGLTRDAVRDAGAYFARDTSGQAVGVVVAQPDTAASDTTPAGAGRVEAWLGAPGRFTWTDTGPGPDNASTEPSREPAGPGPGLALLLAALVLACAEVGLARAVSHASRTGGHA